MVLLSAQHERDIMARTVRERAETTAASLDLLLSTVRARLFALASAAPDDAAGMETFYARASQAIDHHSLMVVLTDASGRKLFNTRAPYGDALPMDADREAIHHVVQSGMPYISNLEISALTRQPVVTVNVPVMRGNKVAYVLSANVLPLIREMITRLDLPADWMCLVSDRAGYTIVRSRAGDRFVGQISRPGFLQRIHSADQGWFAGVARDGVPSYVGFSHARLAGWSVAVAIPTDTLQGPLRHSSGLLLLVGVGILVLALAAALVIARRVSRPIMRLVNQAQAMGDDVPVHPQPTGLQETDAVAQSLHQANQRLMDHAAERDQAMARLRDSEQRFRGLAAELAQANAERLRLLRGTVAAQEAERARVARELHDSLGQYVTALRLGLKAAEPRFGSDSVGREQFAALGVLTGEVGRELNRLAWELRPTALDDLGLETATRQLVDDWAERSGLQFDLHIRLNGRRLATEVETALYRVLQEAVTNAVKHAGGNRVAVILEAAAREVRLIVEDDGKGMPEVNPGRTGTKRLGLVGMRERLALVRGSLEVESAPGGGTTLYARIPL